MALAKARVQKSDEVTKELNDAIDRAEAKQHDKAKSGNASWHEVDESAIEVMLLEDEDEDEI